MSSSLVERMRAVDVAWNARRWDEYRALFTPDFCGWMDADTEPHNLDEHLRRGQAFCAEYPDNQIHIDPYIQIFEDATGTHTCSIALTTSTAPTGEKISIVLIVVCTWRDGRICEQREFIATKPFPLT
jgi:ketosteroid isomerase-like protein